MSDSDSKSFGEWAEEQASADSRRRALEGLVKQNLAPLLPRLVDEAVAHASDWQTKSGSDKWVSVRPAPRSSPPDPIAVLFGEQGGENLCNRNLIVGETHVPGHPKYYMQITADLPLQGEAFFLSMRVASDTRGPGVPTASKRIAIDSAETPNVEAISSAFSKSVIEFIETFLREAMH